MKTYKHKRLWWIAEQDQDIKSIFRATNSELEEEYLKDSQDREEVVESDWIENFANEINYKFDWDMEDFRNILEKHAPKVKKFTKEEVGKYAKDFVFHKQVTEFIICFLKDNWLLEE